MGCERYVYHVCDTLTVSLQHMEPAALLAVTDAKIADMLVGKPTGVHIDELSKQSGLDAAKIGRILRALATKHCFQEGMFVVTNAGGRHWTTAHLERVLTSVICGSWSRHIRQQPSQHATCLNKPCLFVHRTFVSSCSPASMFRFLTGA